MRPSIIPASDSSDQDSPTSLINHNFTMSATNPVPDSSSIPLECVGCPGQFRREFDCGHHTKVVHSPDCSTPDPLMCVGECRFECSEVIVNAAKTKWRRRKLTIACSVMVVLGVAVLSTLGAGVHYLSMLVAKTNTVQDVELGQPATTVATALKYSTGRDTTTGFVPPTALVLRGVAITVLPLEHPEDADWIMATNGIVEGSGNDNTGDSYD